MKKYNYLASTLLIFLLPLTAYAKCTEDEIKHFERIEENYKIEYTLNKETGLYNLTLHNPEPEKYTYEIKTTNTWPNCEVSMTSDTTCNHILPDSYTINVKGNTETCDKILKRNFLKLKPYNKHSEDPLCNDIKEFVLCQETYDKEIDYDTFVSRVKIYKEQKKEYNKENKKKLIDIKKIKTYVEDNLYEVIVIAVFVLLVITTVIITIITYKKSRRLE